MEENDKCRMYEEVYPKIDDLVIVKVTEVTEMGCYVSLLEYGNIQGMILLSDISNRRIRSINKLICVGNIEVASVLRVDQDKGYIDLSKKQVSVENIKQVKEKFTQSKMIHNVMRHTSEITHIPMIHLYQKFGWDLYKRFGHACNAFKQIMNQDESVLKTYQLSPEIHNLLINQINRRFKRVLTKIRAELEVVCFSYEGIDAIKTALKAGENQSTEDIQIKITLIKPPLYVLFVTTMDKDKGMEIIQLAFQAIKKTITSFEGSMVVKLVPTIVTENDDKALNALMTKLQKEKQEIAADDEEIEGM